jgi:hypothetical protein
VSAVSRLFTKILFPPTHALQRIPGVVVSQIHACRRYLERALAFAKQANTNVQDVELPVLIIIANKIDVDECELNIEKTTRYV